MHEYSCTGIYNINHISNHKPIKLSVFTLLTRKENKMRVLTFQKASVSVTNNRTQETQRLKISLCTWTKPQTQHQISSWKIHKLSVLINTFPQSLEVECVCPNSELGNSVGERGFSLSLLGRFYTADGWRQKRERRALSFRERHGGSMISDAFWMSQWVGWTCGPWKEEGRWCEAERTSVEKRAWETERERDKGWVMRKWETEG